MIFVGEKLQSWTGHLFVLLGADPGVGVCNSDGELGGPLDQGFPATFRIRTGARGEKEVMTVVTVLACSLQKALACELHLYSGRPIWPQTRAVRGEW